MMRMAEKTWKDIPIRDIEPMLRSCGASQEWQSFWEHISSGANNATEDPNLSRKSMLTCLLTMSMVVSAPVEDRKGTLEDFAKSFGESDEENILGNAFCFLDKSKKAEIETYYYHIKWLKKGVSSTDPNLESAQQCYGEMLTFAKDLTDVSAMTLGELESALLKWNETPEQRSMKSALTWLEDKLNGDFYKIWYNWSPYKQIQVIPAGEDALNHLEHGVKQIIFNGAPGTGKSYVSELLAQCLGTKLPGEDDPYVRVQFHPSYDYTDFVEGLRPVEKGDKKDDRMIYVKLDGHFKAFCRRVVKENKKSGNTNKKYFFLIDEINRADLSKVFGELMYCLESDKRGEKHKVNTQYQNLPAYSFDSEAKKAKIIEDDCFEKGFYIPENVCIIGTMNDIDRSVESMDFALRRRFEFMEIIMPDGSKDKAGKVIGRETLEKALQALGFGGNVNELTNCIQRLNDKIKTKGVDYGLNRHYYISQGQFANLPTHLTELDKIKKHVWTYRIEPLLREYLRGENETAINQFIGVCSGAFNSEPEAQQTGDAQ